MNDNAQNRDRLTSCVSLRSATCVDRSGAEQRPLYIQRGRIVSSERTGAASIDLRGHLVFPGLVNAHDHLHLNNFPRLPHTLPFANSYAWIDAFQSYMNDPAVRMAREIPVEQRYRQGALKNLLCGVTTVAHHDPWHPTFDNPMFPVRVLRKFGWSHSLGLGLPNLSRSPLQYGPTIVESFCSTSPDWPWIIHLAEGADAIAASELSELDRIGCLAQNSVLVHGVGITPRDIDRIIAVGAGVVWCPGSNLEILGKTLYPRRLANHGLIALGSDSRLTAHGDLLSDLRLAAAHSDLTPPELLDLVTDAGSRLLRLPDVGGLNRSQLADLLIVRDRGDDPFRSLLSLERSDIRAVVRVGVPMVADPDFSEWFAICNVNSTPIRVDGKPKLCASHLLGPPDESILEPGLERVLQ